MKNQMTLMTKLAATAACSLFMAGSAFATAFDSGIPTGWTGTGSYGTSGANGVVTASAEGGQYGWVSTEGGSSGITIPDGISGSGHPTTGSVLRSATFSALAGDALQFFFNYVTSDGSGYADFAWARLLNATTNQSTLLFTARTTLNGDSVPGFEMPAVGAIMNPTNVPIIGGAPNWAPLGGSSSTCYAQGCGYTGWVESNYSILSDGDYVLEFGVVNWNDTAYQSGLAFDGITVGGTPIDPAAGVPEPASLALLGLGLAGIAAFRRRK